MIRASVASLAREGRRMMAAPAARTGSALIWGWIIPIVMRRVMRSLRAI